MSNYADRVESVSISGIREVFEAAGEDAINLGLGQPDFPTPDHIRTAAIEAIEDGLVDGYTSNMGIRPLREAITTTYDDRYGITHDADAVIATSGASEALHLAIQAHVDPGQEVLLPDPGFVSYDALTRLADGTPVPLPLRDDLTLDPATVKDAISEKTAAFIINSPANPTGAVQSKADMQAFAEIADEHDIVCLSDEVYEHIVYDGVHYSPAQFSSTDSVIVISACSKTYSMTGWRLGWVLAAKDRIERMLRVHQYAQACASAPAQYAATAALTGPTDPIDTMVEAFAERRDIVLDGLRDASLTTPTPTGAFYVLPEVPPGWTDAVIENGVIVVPGEAFGANGNGRARLSYATNEEALHDALETIRTVTKSLK